MKIAVIGSLNMDQVITADKIPLKGETLQGKTVLYNPGGKGANQGVAIGKLGGKVSMFGMVGNDEWGKELISTLEKANVNTEHITVTDKEPTGFAAITVAENDNTIVIISGANGCVDINYIENKKQEILAHDIILMQNEIPQETVEYIIEMGAEHNKILIHNPAPIREMDKKYIDMLDYITPNEHEAEILLGDKDIESLVKEYREKLIVTMGEKGVLYSDKNGNLINIKAIEADVQDTTGAGDTFNGAFAYGLALNKPIDKAIEFSNYAAGISIEKMGAQTGMPTLEEVLNRMGQKS